MQEHEKALAKEEKTLEEIQESLKGAHLTVLCSLAAENPPSQTKPVPSTTRSRSSKRNCSHGPSRLMRSRPLSTSPRASVKPLQGSSRLSGRPRKRRRTPRPDFKKRRGPRQVPSFFDSGGARCSWCDRKRNCGTYANAKREWMGNSTS